MNAPLPVGGPPGAVAVDEPAANPGPSDVRVAGVVLAVLTVLGALLGLVWSAWSPPGSTAIVLGGGVFQVLDENENQIAADGRFLLIVSIVGLVAALVTWFGRPRNRGPLVLLGLIVGSLAGAALTDLVGHLTGGGSYSGSKYRLSDGSTQKVTLRLPLSLHMPGLLFVQAALATLIYGVLVAFAVHDDLGRPDPVRDSVLARRRFDASVHPGDDPQGGGGDGDAAGALQQGHFPPQ